MSETTQSTEAPLALAGDGLRESIVDELRRHIGDGLVDHLLKPQDDLWVRIAADRWADTGRALRAMGFEYFCFLSAMDWKPSPFGRGEDDPTQPPPERKTEVVQGYAGGDTRFQVLARVTDIRRHVALTLKADVADDTLSIDSWHAIYAGANWHERETHEMFGILFNGHPDLRNLYLPTEFEGYPLRKDFPLLARMVKPWPGIVDVEPMPAEETPAADADAAVEASPADEAGEAAPTSEAGASLADEAAPASDDATTAAPASDTTEAPAEETGEAAPEMAADPASVTDETADDAPAPEGPAADAGAGSDDATEADAAAEAEPAAESDPAAESPVVADAAAEPVGQIETVAGTADEVEAIADAVADETRDVDERVADAATPPAEPDPSASANEPESGTHADTEPVDDGGVADAATPPAEPDPSVSASEPESGAHADTEPTDEGQAAGETDDD